jgi:uridine phosphorylase
LKERLASFEYQDCRIQAVDMESASIVGMAALLGHKAVSCSIVDDAARNAHLSENNSFNSLVKLVLDRI